MRMISSEAMSVSCLSMATVACVTLYSSELLLPSSPWNVKSLCTLFSMTRHLFSPPNPLVFVQSLFPYPPSPPTHIISTQLKMQPMVRSWTISCEAAPASLSALPVLLLVCPSWIAVYGLRPPGHRCSLWPSSGSPPWMPCHCATARARCHGGARSNSSTRCAAAAPSRCVSAASPPHLRSL